jgi:hypothetical protein
MDEMEDVELDVIDGMVFHSFSTLDQMLQFSARDAKVVPKDAKMRPPKKARTEEVRSPSSTDLSSTGCAEEGPGVPKKTKASPKRCQTPVKSIGQILEFSFELQKEAKGTPKKNKTPSKKLANEMKSSSQMPKVFD